MVILKHMETVMIEALALTKPDPSLLKQTDPFGAHLFTKAFKFCRDARGGNIFRQDFKKGFTQAPEVVGCHF